MTQMQQSVAASEAEGPGGQSRPMHLALLAEAYGTVGRVEDGLYWLAESLTRMDTTGYRHYAAEAYRVKGELLLRQAAPDASQAAACFQHALTIARRQQAKSWELRAAMSLSRLWQRQGQRAAARALLAPIYDWFTEGFGTPDLQDVRALLQELQG
jgi:predicted ATPase